MIRTIGSQNREPIEDTEYTIDTIRRDSIIVKDASGKRELWIRNNRYAGYVIVFKGSGYEFVRSL